jgi:hypothetical protein
MEERECYLAVNNSDIGSMIKKEGQDRLIARNGSPQKWGFLLKPLKILAKLQKLRNYLFD